MYIAHCHKNVGTSGNGWHFRAHVGTLTPIQTTSAPAPRLSLVTSCQSNENYTISYMLRLSREWGNQSKVDRSKNLKCWINFQKLLHSTARVFREKFVHLPQSIQLKYINLAKAFCLANPSTGIINWHWLLRLHLPRTMCPDLRVFNAYAYGAYGSVSFAVLCWVSVHFLAFLLKIKRYWDTAFSVLWLFACGCVQGGQDVTTCNLEGKRTLRCCTK